MNESTLWLLPCLLLLLLLLRLLLLPVAHYSVPEPPSTFGQAAMVAAGTWSFRWGGPLCHLHEMATTAPSGFSSGKWFGHLWPRAFRWWCAMGIGNIASALARAKLARRPIMHIPHRLLNIPNQLLVIEFDASSIGNPDTCRSVFDVWPHSFKLKWAGQVPCPHCGMTNYPTV